MTQIEITMLAEDSVIQDSDHSFQGHTQLTRGGLNVEMRISFHFFCSIVFKNIKIRKIAETGLSQ